jgi:acyl-CoA reductase-like NAD-dependent aldehyde dehydrogenase
VSVVETAPIVRDSFFVGGEWMAPSGSGTIEVIESATEQVMGSVPAGGAQDVDRAVAAARAAFESWSQSSPLERAGYLAAIAAGLSERADELAVLMAREIGMPVRESMFIQAGLPAMDFASVAQLLPDYEFEETVGNSLVVKEAAGVVGCITPWNYPLHQIAAKVSAALGAGCTVVVKPSEITPLNAFVLAEVAAAAGLPAGVLNIVTGTGADVGEPLVRHPDVDVVSFTGSTPVGRKIAGICAETVKRVSLELGGKSPNVLLDDADFTAAVVNGLEQCFLNSGQTCSALTRMLVPRARLAEAEAIAAAGAAQTKVGDPFDPESMLGPLVSGAQRERVRGYIRKGIEEGAKLVAGGEEVPEGLDRGYYVAPTVFSEVTPDMTIAQEEIFGPVLAIMPYDDEDDAVRIANGTIYGLAGGVWSADPERAKRVARRLRTGRVDINGAAFNPEAPFGGFKQSGTGREFGKYGLEEFLELKSLQL